MIIASKEIQEERLNTCKACPLVVVNDKRKSAYGGLWQKIVDAIRDLNELQCSVCGCPTKLRAKQSIVGCPRKKWRR